MGKMDVAFLIGDGKEPATSPSSSRERSPDPLGRRSLTPPLHLDYCQLRDQIAELTEQCNEWKKDWRASDKENEELEEENENLKARLEEFEKKRVAELAEHCMGYEDDWHRLNEEKETLAARLKELEAKLRVEDAM